MDKLDFINSYIKRCEKILEVNDYSAAKEIQTEIISTFEDEIKNIRGNLDNYSMVGFYQVTRKVDFIGDLKLLKQKLEKYYLTFKMKSKKTNTN